MQAQPDTVAFDAVLKRHVLNNGTVRYAALKADIDPLRHFVEQLATTSPDSHPALFPSREQKLAYWINAYNALVLYAMVREYPEKKDRLGGVLGKAVFFYRMKHIVGGQSRSLDDIETNSIRSAGDPRVHFAIVCASTGCPWLSRDAFTGERLGTQLEERTKVFLSQDRNVRIDAASRRVTVSKIFDWFKKDFGGDPLRFIARYRPELGSGKWQVRYFDYDWSLNDAK
jgi:hypothetical protein